MGWLRKHRGYILVVLAQFALTGVGLAAARWPHPEPIAIVEPTSPPAPTALVAPLQVHVTGAVQRPGVYRLAPGSRLVQAVEAAGGMAPDADEERMNLADRLVDGQQVYVPRRGTPIPPSPTAAARLSSASPGHSGASGEAVAVDGVVNINTATVAELETLPGIGPALAQRIVEHREANGPFADPAEIVAVRGIGEATYTKLADRIAVQ